MGFRSDRKRAEVGRKEDRIAGGAKAHAGKKDRGWNLAGARKMQRQSRLGGLLQNLQPPPWGNTPALKKEAQHGSGICY